MKPNHMDKWKKWDTKLSVVKTCLNKAQNRQNEYGIEDLDSRCPGKGKGTKGESEISAKYLLLDVGAGYTSKLSLKTNQMTSLPYVNFPVCICFNKKCDMWTNE